MGLWFQQRSRNATLRLVPIVYRASLYKLQTTVADELEKNTHAGIYVPRPDSDPLYVEIAAWCRQGFVGSGRPRRAERCWQACKPRVCCILRGGRHLTVRTGFLTAREGTCSVRHGD